MGKKTAVFLIISWMICNTTVFPQDVPYSQYYSNLVYLNPAFAGSRNECRINFFYRNQWINSGAGFQSFGVSYDTPLKKWNSGIGIIASNDINGAFIQPSVDFIYNYKFRPSRYFYITTALQAGIVQKYIAKNDLNFGETNEIINQGFSKVYPDFAIGITLFYKKFYSGISVDHIARPFQGISHTKLEQLNRKYTLFVGYVHPLKTKLINQQRIISPNILIQMQGAQNNICWGSSFQYDHIAAGLWLRNIFPLHFDAAIIMIGFRNKNWRVSYSYDVNMGKQTNLPLGSHEISFVKLFETRLKKKFKAISCPTFLL